MAISKCTNAERRAKQAKRKMLKARADAQAFNQSLFSTCALRHGRKDFADHGTYGALTDHQKQGMGGHDNDK
jgi:hypothetical protein